MLERGHVVKPYYADESACVPTPLDESTPQSTDHLTITVMQEQPVMPKRGRGRPRKHATFLTVKEKADFELALKLRREGAISTPGAPFEQADKKEIDALVARGVSALEQYDASKHSKQRIFKSRIVREIKGKQTTVPYEKSRLVIQVYNDAGKEFVLT